MFVFSSYTHSRGPSTANLTYCRSRIRASLRDKIDCDTDVVRGVNPAHCRSEELINKLVIRRFVFFCLFVCYGAFAISTDTDERVHPIGRLRHERFRCVKTRTFKTNLFPCNGTPKFASRIFSRLVPTVTFETIAVRARAERY